MKGKEYIGCMILFVNFVVGARRKRRICEPVNRKDVEFIYWSSDEEILKLLFEVFLYVCVLICRSTSVYTKYFSPLKLKFSHALVSQ